MATIKKLIKNALKDLFKTDYGCDVPIERIKGSHICRMITKDPTKEVIVLVWNGREVVYFLGRHTLEDCDALNIDLFDALADTLCEQFLRQVANRIGSYKIIHQGESWEFVLLEDTDEYDGVKIVSDGTEVRVKCKPIPDEVLPNSIEGMVDRLFNY